MESADTIVESECVIRDLTPVLDSPAQSQGILDRDACLIQAVILHNGPQEPVAFQESSRRWLGMYTCLRYVRASCMLELVTWTLSSDLQRFPSKTAAPRPYGFNLVWFWQLSVLLAVPQVDPSRRPSIPGR
jgi:hypothetical protein